MVKRSIAGWLMLALVGAGARLALADDAPPPPPFWVMYDLNHDGKVDDADIGKFAEYWIAYHVNSTYTAAADFNGDERIDYFDAMRIIEAVIRATASSQGVGSQAAGGSQAAAGSRTSARMGLAKAIVEGMVRAAGSGSVERAGR